MPETRDESSQTLPNPPPFESTVPPPAPALEVPVEEEDRPTEMSAEQKYRLTWLIVVSVLLALCACLYTGIRVNASNNDKEVDRTRAETEACTELTNDVDQVQCMERVD